LLDVDSSEQGGKMATWIEDKNGNKCSVEYWGSKEKAQAALDSLKDCKGCSDCSGCSGCSGCSRCSGLKDKKQDTGDFKPPIVPVIPEIHKRVYEAASQPDSLQMNDWHTCEKTHCRGGWVVTLAGKEGRELEKFHGTALAAMLIYDASDLCYKINPARFYDSNEEALKDMKEKAGA
jgi:hypothetical protein